MTQLAMADRDPGGSEWGWEWDWSFGRHAFREDAALTPIFHALARGEVNREPEPAAGFPVVEAAIGAPAIVPAVQVDPVDAFHRDPLTAPIPIQSLITVPSQTLRRPEPHPAPVVVAQGGRHHFRPATAGVGVSA